MISSCGKDQLETDIDKIKDYIEENGLTADRTTTGLHFVIDDPGNGVDRPNIFSEVKVNYVGRLLDGTVFDQSDTSMLTFYPLAGFIPGWQEGIPKFTKGGSGTLLLPSRLGYGQELVGDIPPNSVLIFDIILVDVD